ncbi:MAG TPA: hypothetical protein VJ824_05595 [Bacillota bacterium]|nr:hypothetical protein [Bacillota bacterium]
MNNLEKHSIRELLTQLEDEVLAEHQLFFSGRYHESDECKKIMHLIKQEILQRIEQVV